MKNNIPVFLSVGTMHSDLQKEYYKKFLKHLKNRGIKAETLGRTFWSIKQPLQPIRKKMQEVYGVAILAMERFHSKNGIYKENSAFHRLVDDQYFPTVWVHIEAAMAYQLDLPILILKEDKLISEGMLDRGIHEWLVISIHPENPKEQKSDPVKGYIDCWIATVKERFLLNRSK